jgi:replicative DNA helicase
MAGGSMADVQAAIARAATRHPNLALAVVDYTGLVAPSDRYRGNKANEIGEITGQLKACAKRHGIAILALVQLNRSVESREDKRPTLADLRDSGSIEQDADLVLLLYRESYYLERASVAPGSNEEASLVARLGACQGVLEIIIRKNRQGPTGTAKVYVNLATNGISDERLWQ